jgi:hypothetical protein
MLHAGLDLSHKRLDVCLLSSAEPGVLASRARHDLAPVQARSRLLETASKDLTHWLGRAIQTAAHRPRTLLTADRRAQFKLR